MVIWRVVLCVLAMACSVRAEDVSLRWKFTPGDSQLYRMTQTAKMDLNLGGASNVSAEVWRVFDFEWSVDEVAAEGSATISVQVTRARLHVVGPGGQETEYDTESDQPARGFAATLAPLFKTLLASELKAAMNSRGELSRLQIPEDLQLVLSSKPAGKALGQLGSEDDFRSLLQLGLPALPASDAFAEGEQWEADRELENIPFGSPKAHTVYRWDATKQHEGEQLAVIAPTTSIRLNRTAGNELITEQKSDGEILFNLTAGRLQSSHVEMQLDLNSSDGGQATTGTLVHTLVFEQMSEEEAN